MPDHPKKSPAEREQTNESLRTERTNTDAQLNTSQTAIQEDADGVVGLARQRADDTLRLARGRARAKLEDKIANTALDEVQETEDALLAAERATSDAELEVERERRHRALTSLLHLEREQTDKHLLIERARSDDQVSRRDDFLGMVSHDLRTILGGIALSAARLIRNAGDDEKGVLTVKLADGIQRYSARMNRLVGDLIDVSSIESGQLAVVPARHDAVKLVRDMMEVFQLLAAERGVALEAELVQDPVLAKFDHERILQVLGNLISNAIKFTPQGGSVQLRVEKVGHEVRFSVTDTGSGVPADKADRIFERFWQAKSNDRRGLGLGLFISRCIVEAHGGRIWVERSSTQGSTFCFTLPGATTA